MRHVLAFALLLVAGCSVASRCGVNDTEESARTTAYDEARARMVREQLVARDIRDERVLDAMRRIPRHELVPESVRASAYRDGPLPIGEGQTISQPYIVAAMSQAVALDGSERVLEVGTGSGYQAAVLSHLAREVYTIELEPTLAARAKADLERLGYQNVTTRTGDGYAGWPEAAPFNAIVVTAAPDHVPEALVEQLAPGGLLVIPVGARGGVQSLLLIEKTATGVVRRELMPVSFVPLRRDPED
jgi:protein-L-isoaspartate(D-aspartate) O-methyltransferase